MYKRFLNNNDYSSIITDEAMMQLTRGKENRIEQAEQFAEESMLEYLTDNYEIEKALMVGKNILPYNSLITYPVGSHFYYEGKICEAIRSINGGKTPFSKEYWAELAYDERKYNEAKVYSQFSNYVPGDVVIFAGAYYECVEYNGIDYNDIRIPGVQAWEKLETYTWEPNVPYQLWNVVKYNGKFYALTDDNDVDLTLNPFDSTSWGQIGEYEVGYRYEYVDTEYVVFDDNVYYPIMPPVADELIENFNFREHDPRNGNVKKHMVRLAVYELHKLISPNNISSSRITDYEASLAWLRDANRCKINPMIPRKLDEENHPVAEFAIATFMKDYDPNKNPWQI